MKVESKTLLQKYIVNEKVELYLEEVLAANKKFNLFSRSLGEDALKTLIAESLLPLDLGWVAAGGGAILDIGSGWGIPSLPLLMADRAFNITFVERSQKKADFLLLLLHRLGLKAKIVNEELAKLSGQEKYSFVFIRQIKIDEKNLCSIRCLANDNASLIYFGKELQASFFKSLQVIDYSIDGSDIRYLIKASI